MTHHFDALETRSSDQRESDQLAVAKQLFPSAASLTALSELSELPVFRKSELTALQSQQPPLGGVPAVYTHLFQSPGPIHEPGNLRDDWWRFGRFAHAVGLGPEDIVQNTFSYHFTPAGMMFDSAAVAVGATVFPAGPGNTQEQVTAAARFACTAYAGTPDYLQTILAKADEAGVALAFKRAMVSAGPLFPQVRQAYADRGITCRQCYATADVGLIAYETADDIDAMIVDENVIAEIVTPGTGKPVAAGEIGEVLVTVLNPDYPLLRFATGDMSSIVLTSSSCGRSNVRLSGWKGRADQSTKVRGQFVRPEQVAEFLDRHPEVLRARIEVGHDGTGDTLTAQLEIEQSDATADRYTDALVDAIRVRPLVELVAPGSLPRDGVVIADGRPVQS